MKAICYQSWFYVVTVFIPILKASSKLVLGRIKKLGSIFTEHKQIKSVIFFIDIKMNEWHNTIKQKLSIRKLPILILISLKNQFLHLIRSNSCLTFFLIQLMLMQVKLIILNCSREAHLQQTLYQALPRQRYQQSIHEQCWVISKNKSFY